MWEDLGLEGWTPIGASVAFGLALGALFGLFAERSAFCLRRAIAGESAEERRSAAGVWALAFAVALAGVQAAATQGWIALDETRFHAESLPLLALIVGGVMFGAGMVLTRGCASRLTVLGATGNLRALTVILVFAVVAHATLKGALAPLRVALSSFAVDAPASVPAVLGESSGLVVALAVLAAALVFAARSGAKLSSLAFGAGIGLLVPLGWVGTGFVLMDEFDPITVESIAFTSSASETLFWTVAGTAVAAGFGVGFFGGVLGGAFASASLAGRARLVSFESPSQTLRYLAGGVMMGFGGVLAGGCTVGAGLTGASTLGVSALVALASIIAGGFLATRLGAMSAGAVAIPAE